ncbi:MAG: EVE domain-containing protein [Candidatus Geothermarchaeales archaeon]
MQYWLVVTSPNNFRKDREELGFKFQGLPHHYRNQVQRMETGDRVLYYVMKLGRFGATATVTGDYFESSEKLWTDEEEMWPSRRPSRPDLVLADDELLDAKKLISDLSFVKNPDRWGVHFQGSIKTIPESDFKLIESEMKKIVEQRGRPEDQGARLTEREYEERIKDLPLQSESLHDRLGEMLEQIGSWMDYNAQTRYKIAPDHAYELDVAWLSGRNPEIAVEVQVSGNLTEAKDRLAQARKFNFRKVILVLRRKDLDRLDKLLRYEPELRSWLEPWSIGAVYDMYVGGKQFFSYYRRLIESTWKQKPDLEMVR